jgi:hypothetical protein
MSNATHKATRVYNETYGDLEGYIYRGVEITLNTEVPTTYFGRYTTGGYRNGDGFSSLKEAKAGVDHRIDQSKKETA